MEGPAEYEPRYLAGVVLFNRHDFFAAHEVWEDLWRECAAADRRFYQGLIQASVALYHGLNGNWRGARRLFHSGRSYMSVYAARQHGLETARFWNGMERCLARLLGEGEPAPAARADPESAPRIELDPPPAAWPDPSAFLDDH
jgi:uncharacterized protein